MAQTQTPPPVDKQDLDNARQMWLGFTDLIKYGSVGVAAVLVLMLLFVY